MPAKKLSETSMLAAIVFISMLLINIRLFGSTLHIGSLSIVIICLLFERNQAVTATCLGSIFYDLAAGLFIYLPFTITARLLMSLIISFGKDKALYKQILFTVVGSFIVVFVYFISFIIFFKDVEVAIYSSSADTIQIIFNVAAIFVVHPIKTILEKLSW